MHGSEAGGGGEALSMGPAMLVVVVVFLPCCLPRPVDWVNMEEQATHNTAQHSTTQHGNRPTCAASSITTTSNLRARRVKAELPLNDSVVHTAQERQGRRGGRG